jgi:LPS-assembly lipoprotein
MTMRFAALLLPLLIGACGFQLRGADVLPPDLGRLYLSAPDILRIEVGVFLEGSRTELVDDRATANVVLTMATPRYGRRVLSVDANTGKEKEIELSYTVDVNASSTAGRTLLQAQPVTILRDYIFDPDTLLGTGREEVVIQAEMRRDLVQQVLFRLRAAATG